MSTTSTTNTRDGAMNERKALSKQIHRQKHREGERERSGDTLCAFSSLKIEPEFANNFDYSKFHFFVDCYNFLSAHISLSFGHNSDKNSRTSMFTHVQIGSIFALRLCLGAKWQMLQLCVFHFVYASQPHTYILILESHVVY